MQAITSYSVSRT